MEGDIKIPFDKLKDRTKELLQSRGMPSEYAALASEALCTASLRGVDSHGIRLFPHYLSALESGRINPAAEFSFVKTAPCGGVFDANHGMAHAAMCLAMDRAVELAEESGAGLVTVKNSNHCGEMGFYGLRAAEKDMIGFAVTNTTPKLKVHNSTETFFGTNPICFTAPMHGEGPFCFDASPAVMASNKIKMYAQLGKNIPRDVATDISGLVTTNPAIVKMLLPLGGIIAGHKGYGLSMIVDILSSLLTGMPAGKDISAMYESDGGSLSEPRLLGHFVAAIRIDMFIDVNEFKERLALIAEKIRRLNPMPDSAEPVMVPGDPEKKISAGRLVNGIPLSRELYRELFERGT